MRHDPVGGCALRGMYRPHPSGPDMPVGKAGEVEGLVLTVLPLDHDATPLRIDPDHAGGVSVQPSRAAVVAGELYPVPGAQLLLDLDERLGLIAAPLRGRPGDGLDLRYGERDGARLGFYISMR